MTVRQIHLTMTLFSLKKYLSTANSETDSGSLTHLIAVDTHVMSGDEGLEDHHPAGIGGSLEQCVSHLRDVHVGGIRG